MRLSKVAVQRPITTVMFFSAIMLLGFVSLAKLPIQFFPDISHPYGGVFVRTRQSLGLDEMERRVIRPIEGEISMLPNVKEFQVQSFGSGAFFSIEFEFGTDVRYRIVDLQERLDAFRRANFEPRALDVGAFNFETSWFNKQFMDLSLKGPRSDPLFQAVNTERLRQRLEDIDGVAQADIWGGDRRTVDVRLLQDRLREFNTPLWQVINTVRTYANEPVFLGDIEDEGLKYFVRLNGQFKDSSEIENVFVKEEGNIAVRHLGEVVDAFRSRRFMRRVDGKPALGMDLEKEAQVNPIELSQRTRKVVDQINRDMLPEGYELTILWDQADNIRDVLNVLSRLALLGVVLSMSVLYMFIRNVKMTLIVCVVIPICIVATFNAMYFSSMSINMISLLGLAVGVGCLIDTSIVVLENVFRHHELGRDGVTSALFGTREVGMAVFAVTVTNIIVFLPIVFVDGEIRLVFTEGALALVYPMLISMLVALTLVPMASAHILNLADKSKKLLERRASSVGKREPSFFSRNAWMLNPLELLSRMLDKILPSMLTIRRRYGSILKSCLRHRVRFLIAIVLAILYTFFYSMNNIDQDVMEDPGQEESDSFYLFVYMPNGTKQDHTLKVLEKVEDMLMTQVPEAEHVNAWVEDDFARMRVDLVDLKERERESNTIREELRPQLEGFADAEVTFNYTRTRGEDQQPTMDSGQGGVIEIRGPEYEQINTIAESFSQVLLQLPDIRDVASETEAGPLELHFALDRDTGAYLQITPETVAQTVQVAQRQGEFASILMKKGDDEIDILFSQYQDPEKMMKPEISRDEGLKFEELKQIPIFSPFLNSTVALEDLGTFKITRGMGSVQRENRERIGRIRFDTAPNSKYVEVEQTIRELVKAFPAPAGYRLSLGGKSRQLEEELAAVKLMLWLAILLIYMCIASLFESFSQPLIIMFSIPLALIGIVWAMIWTGTVFSPLSALGCILLIGLLPNSPILLVHFTGYLRRVKNYPRQRAIMTAGYTRLRPIFMTVLTTVLGMLPMAIPWRGDSDWVPFAIPVIGGLISSTILTLLIVPGFYFIIEDIANLVTRIFRYVFSWRWIFVFWSKKSRHTVYQDVTAYRTQPPREEPLLVCLDHLTRIYPPSRLESFSIWMKRRFFWLRPSPALGFVPQWTPMETKPSTQARRKAVDMISLDIDSGLFGLLGPNGAGKTTLLRLISGIDQATRGYLSICGYDMKTEARQAQKLIGYLPQYFGVYSHMTAYQYLDYFALLKGIRLKKARHATILNALEMTNLSDQIHVPVNQFSGGMMRRIGLAQIFLQPPRVLIVDEPTVGLDPMERVRFRNLLTQLSQERIVILSTHIVEDVAHSCKRMALMEDGKIQYSGSTEEFVSTVKNKVWELTVSTEAEWKDVRKRFRVVGQAQTAEGIHIRIISDLRPSPDAVLLEPGLEDAYLYHIHDRQTPEPESA